MNFLIGPLRRLGSRPVQQEIDEELQLHLDLLTAEHCRQNLSWEQAQAAAVKRFGNVEQIKEECVRIARRNQPLILALKWFFGFVFVTGVLVRIFGTDYHVTRVGDLLMWVGVLSRLLLYVRGMNRTKYVSKPDDAASIKLNDSAISLAAYDRSKRTPVERVISYK